MPRVELELRQTGHLVVTEPAGSARSVPVLRPFATLQIVGMTRVVEALVDTGAPLSALPVGAWEPLCDASLCAEATGNLAVAPCPVFVSPADQGVPVAQLREISVLGCKYRVRHGWIPLAVTDTAGNQLPPVDTAV